MPVVTAMQSLPLDITQVCNARYKACLMTGSSFLDAG